MSSEDVKAEEIFLFREVGNNFKIKVFFSSFSMKGERRKIVS
jgi:hypothetical protein